MYQTNQTGQINQTDQTNQINQTHQILLDTLICSG